MLETYRGFNRCYMIEGNLWTLLSVRGKLVLQIMFNALPHPPDTPIFFYFNWYDLIFCSLIKSSCQYFLKTSLQIKFTSSEKEKSSIQFKKREPVWYFYFIAKTIENPLQNNSLLSYVHWKFLPTGYCWWGLIISPLIHLPFKSILCQNQFCIFW